MHFHFWSNKWDEWIARDSSRLAPYGAHVHVAGAAPRVGQRVDCRDSHGKWLRAEVIESADGGKVKVHFHRYAPKFDEWVLAADVGARIGPFGERTSMHAVPCDEHHESLSAPH